MKHLSEKCGLLILRTSTFCTDQSNKWKSRSSTDGISDLSYQECVLVGIGAGKRDKKGKTFPNIEASQNNPKSPTHFIPAFLHLYIQSLNALFFKYLPVLVIFLSALYALACIIFRTPGLQAVWLESSFLTSLGLQLFAYKMEKIIVATS